MSTNLPATSTHTSEASDVINTNNISSKQNKKSTEQQRSRQENLEHALRSNIKRRIKAKELSK